MLTVVQAMTHAGFRDPLHSAKTREGYDHASRVIDFYTVLRDGGGLCADCGADVVSARCVS